MPPLSPSAPSTSIPFDPTYYFNPAAWRVFAPEVNPFDLELHDYSVGELNELRTRIADELAARINAAFLPGDIISIRNDVTHHRFVVVVAHEQVPSAYGSQTVFYRDCGKNVIYKNEIGNIRHAV